MSGKYVPPSVRTSDRTTTASVRVDLPVKLMMDIPREDLGVEPIVATANIPNAGTTWPIGPIGPNTADGQRYVPKYMYKNGVSSNHVVSSGSLISGPVPPTGPTAPNASKWSSRPKQTEDFPALLSNQQQKSVGFSETAGTAEMAVGTKPDPIKSFKQLFKEAITCDSELITCDSELAQPESSVSDRTTSNHSETNGGFQTVPTERSNDPSNVFRTVSKPRPTLTFLPLHRSPSRKNRNKTLQVPQSLQSLQLSQSGEYVFDDPNDRTWEEYMALIRGQIA